MSYRVRFVDYAAQYHQHQDELDDAWFGCIERGDLILREDLERFEKNLAKFLGVKHVIGVASGTDALVLTLRALNIGAGDEVIVPSYTFRATVEAVLQVGATPVLVDKGEDWKKAKTKKTKVIIPAHLEGEIVHWTPDADVLMIEDACQAIGAKELTGIAAAYSFYPAKILGCLGDGGAIATNDDKLADTLYKMRNHCKGEWDSVGTNSRLDNIQAAILDVRLKYLPQALLRRKEIARRYDTGLALGVVGRPVVREIYQDYIIFVKDRDGLYDYLESKGIQTMKNGYPFPAVVQKLPETIKYEEHTLRIPCNETLSNEQIEYVIESINEYVRTV